jgi:DNA-binding response OmpR family regulator
MERSPLEGRSILIVEDEPLIIMDIQLALEDSGAMLHIASTVKDGLRYCERDGLALGILDHGLADGESTELYSCLFDRGVPFIIYTGHDVPEDARHGGVVISKPALEMDIRAIAEELVLEPGANGSS